MKVDKTLVASVALHVVVLGWGLVSFSSKAFESTEIESVPVEFVTDNELSKITAGIKSGKKENPKPLVEKVAEAKPVDDAVGKVTEKKAIVTDAAPDPAPFAGFGTQCSRESTGTHCADRSQHTGFHAQQCASGAL